MKRARVTTHSEAACAHARPCPVSPDVLLTLLENTDVTVWQMCASTSALGSITVDLVARKDESLQLAAAQVASSRSALLSHKTRVLGFAKQLSCKQCKRIVADSDATYASTKQLRVWATMAGAGVGCCPDLDCVLAASPLFVSPPLVQSTAIGLGSIIDLRDGGELGSAVTGDGLRAVSTAGPGLKWFEPHARNEFSVVLTQADGSVPVWLTTGDIVVDIVSSDGTPAAGAQNLMNSAAAAWPEWVRHGTVNVVYGDLRNDAAEIVLLLSVCGLPVSGFFGRARWRVRVPQKPLASHECAAVGTHVRTLAVARGWKYGMAVSADEKWLVVGLDNEGTLSVYSLPGGELVRTFGGRGVRPLEFYGPSRLCFAPNGDLIVVDRGNRRLQEVTLEGVFVRFIGVRVFGDSEPFCVAVYDDVIAVGCSEGSGPRVVLFDFDTGSVTSRFGAVGTARGQLSRSCTGIRLTLDGRHVIVAEDIANRISMLTTAGVFVRCLGARLLRGGSMDLVQSVTGDYVVVDYHNHRVCVFSPNGSQLVRSWGVKGASDGQFENPTTLAAAGRHLYVMDYYTGRVQVFE